MTGLSASRLAFPEAVSRPGLWFKVLRPQQLPLLQLRPQPTEDRKSTRLNSSHSQISYAVFCLKKKKNSVVEVPADAQNTQHVDVNSAFGGMADRNAGRTQFEFPLIASLHDDSVVAPSEPVDTA